MKPAPTSSIRAQGESGSSLTWKKKEVLALQAELHEARAGVAIGIDPVRAELGTLLDRDVIHYMSFFVIDAVAGDEQRCPATVVLELNADGTARSVRKLLAESAPVFLRRLFEGCDGFESSFQSSELRSFLERADVGANAYYLAFPGRSVKQIKAERKIAQRASGALGKLPLASPAQSRCPVHAQASGPRLSPTSASGAWRALQTELGAESAALPGPARPWFVRWGPNGDGLRNHLNLWSKRLGSAVFAALGVSGALHTGSPGVGRLLYAALALLCLGVTAAVFLAEGPRALTWAGRGLIVREALKKAFGMAAMVVLSAGTLAQVLHAAGRVSVAVALLSLGAVAGALLSARRLGVSNAGLCAVGVVVLSAALVPAKSLFLIPLVLMGLAGLAVVAIAAGFAYIMDGRMAALATAALTAAAWGLLMDFVARALRSPHPPWLYGVLVAGLFVLAAYGAAFRVAYWFYSIRRLEEHEEGGPLGWDIDHLNQVEDREDVQLQNHLATVSLIKQDAGGLRLRTLERVLRAVALVAKVYCNQGDLGGIRAIHFARFVIMPDKKRLLFMGNYDGGFGSYLQEFNKVSEVTAVWSNCVGFPRAFFLGGDGARDEQRFKAFGRRCQVPTLGWFSAYPDLSIRDIETGTRTREDLARSIADGSTFWGRMRERFGEPLSEAECDLGLRRL